MSSRLVFNASPLIILGKANLLSPVPEMADQIVIPAGVAREITATPKEDPAKTWLLENGKQFIKTLPAIDSEVRAWDLGQGESEVLSFARQESDWTCVIDDQSARNCATALGLQKCGTLGILVRLKRRHLIPEGRDVLADVTAAGYYISPELLSEVRKLLN